MLHFYLPQRLALGLTIGLSAVLSITLIYVCWQWYDDFQLAHTHQTSITLPTTTEAATLITNLPNTHLFGKGMAGLPITSLHLLVTGIVKVGDEPNASSKAYISISGQPSKIYHVGDELPGGVHVYSISNDTIILENDGELEKLPLPRQPLQFKPRSTEE